MKRFLLTSASFGGHIELVYREARLIKVELTDAELDDVQKRWLLGNIAVIEPELPGMIQRMKSVTCIQEDFKVSLDDFKREYPYQRNSHLLDPIWQRMGKTDQVLAVMGAAKYRRWTDREKQRNPNYVPKIAASWLREKQWLNEWDRL